MNEQILWQFFQSLSKEEQQELEKRVSNIILVEKISPEVFMEAVEDLFRDYPIIKKESGF